MKKILTALILTVVLSGNVYPNFITDLFKSEAEKILTVGDAVKFIESKAN